MILSPQKPSKGHAAVREEKKRNDERQNQEEEEEAREHNTAGVAVVKQWQRSIGSVSS